MDPGLKMYFLLNPIDIENGDLPANYVSLPEGTSFLVRRTFAVEAKTGWQHLKNVY